MQPQTLPVSLLESLQHMMNTALQLENTRIAEHVDHDHFDYVDSDEPNALAFCSDSANRGADGGWSVPSQDRSRSI